MPVSDANNAWAPKYKTHDGRDMVNNYDIGRATVIVSLRGSESPEWVDEPDVTYIGTCEDDGGAALQTAATFIENRNGLKRE